MEQLADFLKPDSNLNVFDSTILACRNSDQNSLIPRCFLIIDTFEFWFKFLLNRLYEVHTMKFTIYIVKFTSSEFPYSGL